MHLLYHDLVMDAERECTSKHDDARLAVLAALRQTERSSVRHRLAVALARLSRASAAGARRLDGSPADDLPRHLAATR